MSILRKENLGRQERLQPAPKLIILVGKSGAGKSTFAEAMNCDNHRFEISGLAKRELREEGVGITHDSIQAILHKRYTTNPYWQIPHIAARLEKQDFLILDGPRSAREVKRLKELYPDTLVIEIRADITTRFKRLRDRDNVSIDEFKRIEDDETEETELMEISRSLVDVVIENNSSLESFREAAEELGVSLKASANL